MKEKERYNETIKRVVCRMVRDVPEITDIWFGGEITSDGMMFFDDLDFVIKVNEERRSGIDANFFGILNAIIEAFWGGEYYDGPEEHIHINFCNT